MASTWIVHRDERGRAALARLAAVHDAIVGAPDDAHFDSAPPAEVVVLGLWGDWEAELEFAHRQAPRLAGARWILVGERARFEAARQLFDRGAVEFLAYPPPARQLRRHVADAALPRPSLSERERRALAAKRFARWFGGRELPGLMRALDPKRAATPLLVRGEPGSGRAALIRYVHHFGGTADGALLHLPCSPDTPSDEIAAALAAFGRAWPRVPSLCVWLDEAGRLSPPVQRALAGWLDAGPPPGVRAPTLRWVASVDASGAELEDEFALAIGRLEIDPPPLRERSEDIEAIAADTATDWSQRYREPLRHFSPDAIASLKDYPWPGNLRELETLLERSLADGGREVIDAADLRWSRAAAPLLDAESVGTLLSDTALETGLEVQPPAAAAVPTERQPEAEAPHRGDTVPEVRAHSTLRSFAELMPARFQDPEFRARFERMVREDDRRSDGLLARLDHLPPLGAAQREKLDVSALLEELLEARRDHFRQRHLLVLKELETQQPIAIADPRQLRLAFEALIDQCLETVPERGDLYLASRHHDGDGIGGASMRVLMRFPDPGDTARLEDSLALLVAEAIVRAQRGRFTLGASEAEERVVVVDLPAP